MKPTNLEFSFDGATAAADAQALASFLAAEFPDWPARTATLPVSTPVPGTRDAALTISILALLVALPSGLNDGLDLVQRLQLKTKLEHLIAWAKARHARRERNPFIALPPHGAALPLDQARPEQLLDAVTALVPKGPRKP